LLSSILKILLFPFSLIYGLVVIIRNRLYDNGILKSYSFDFPVIGIGNLSVGGTGKTPMTEYVAELLLKNNYKVGIISRGYGRKTKGFLLADSEKSNASEIGDEPFQILKKFPEANLAVSEDRVNGVKELKKLHPEIDVIVLDDCFQHRKIKPGFMILLTDYNKPYFKDWLLPSGRLREPISERKRADIIIMTKSPLPLENNKKTELKNALKPLPKQEVYFTGIRYQELESVSGKESINLEELKPENILLFCGIANPSPLVNFAGKNCCKLKTITFPDHHDFSGNDIEKILQEWKNISSANKIIITTEKDWRRLENTRQAEPLKSLPLYFLPIGLDWDLQEKLSFDKKLLTYV
jgi:tetraacyldisaccharide 4'-kinase